jgi:hypothetical protein
LSGVGLAEAQVGLGEGVGAALGGQGHGVAVADPKDLGVGRHVDLDVLEQLGRGGGGPQQLGRDRGHRLGLGQLALVEHVELLVDPLAGVEGVGGDRPDQHRGG